MNKKSSPKFFLKLLIDFNKEKDLEKAITSLMNEICQAYNFNKVTSFFNEQAKEEFIWLHTYNHEENVLSENSGSTNIDMENYPVRMTRKNFEREQKLYKLFSENNIIYTRKINTILDELDTLNYTDYDQKKISAFLICGFTDENDVIGYSVFERHNTDFISKEDFENLESFLETVNISISSNEKFKEVDKKYEISRVLIDTIQVDSYSAVLEKGSLKVLYYENSQGVVFDEKEIIRKREEVLFDLTYVYDKLPINKIKLNESVQFKRSDGEYLIRVSEMNWLSKKDAYIVSVMNVTKAFENKLSYDHLTDSLTWFGFKEKIKKMCLPSEPYAYISLNIEGMKLINFAHTQTVGNEILKQLSITIKQFIYADEFYCRVVADTFAIVIKYVDDIVLNHRVSELNSLLTKMCREIFSEVILTITGGICIIESDLYKNIDLGFENSGLARSTTKGSYKNTFAVYNENMRKRLQINKHIESKIETAIANDEFSAYLQPKFDLITNEIVGAEALVRWHSSEETLYPDKFIPVFESDGFISVLDFIVYEKIFIFIKECLDKNIKMVTISINASRNHIHDEYFFEKLLLLFEKHKVPRHFIEIEITENASEESDEELKDFVKKLKNENISVSMDDFGSAYSSLNLLKTLDLDTLKLDKAFLGKVEKEKFTDLYSKDEIIIKHIVSMAKELGFKVLCEGVETKEQSDFLRDVGCDYGQGFILSKPVPLETFKEKFLKQE